MKTLKTITKTSILIAFSSLLMLSCKDGSTEASDSSEIDHSEMDHSEMNHSDMDGGSEMMEGEPATSENASGEQEVNAEVGKILDNYLQVKDALVTENQEKAAAAGGDLAIALEEIDTQKFEKSQQQELKEIIEVAKEHAEHISGSDIAHQREHFDMMSVDIKDLVAITGTDRKLYQAYCPMYNENKGAIWLSESAEIRNPYFGSKMLTCGSVQAEIE